MGETGSKSTVGDRVSGGSGGGVKGREGEMNGWMKGGAGMVLALVGAGCVLPVEVRIDDGVWGEIRGNGRVVFETRTLPPFDGIVANGGIRVVVERTGREEVSIEAEENLIPYLEAEVRGGILHVGPVPGARLSPRRDVVFRVESWKVVEVEAAGASLVDVEVGRVAELWATASGASSLTLWGDAGIQHLTLSGASRYDALDLRSRRTDARLSGASQAWVSVTDRLEAEATGASHVRFRGNPWVSAHVSGASSVGPYQ